MNLSDLPFEEAERIQKSICKEGKVFASRRNDEYLAVRRALEDRVRNLFIEKGGRPVRERPHYMTLGPCSWLKEWYVEGCELNIPLSSFKPDTISFTYGDTFPAMRYQDGKPYRGKVYTVKEISGIIETYGLPQEWNKDGKYGPERYIEAQVWDDEPIKRYLGTEL